MAENGDDESPRLLQLAVVGSSGFLGRSLTASALAAGHAVIEYEVDTPPIREGVLAEGIAESDVVYWLASRCNPATAESHPEWAHADVKDFAEFLQLMARLQHMPKVILASSGGTIYGNGEPPFVEESPLAPTGIYGRSKQEAEAVLWASGVPGAAARISNPYGPGQRPGTGQGVVAQWLDDILSGRTPTLIGPPGPHGTSCSSATSPMGWWHSVNRATRDPSTSAGGSRPPWRSLLPRCRRWLGFTSISWKLRPGHST